MNEDKEDMLEEYCGDCGCISDDEVCPRCIAESVDVSRRRGLYQGDRRWNGEVMTKNHDNTLDDDVVIHTRNKSY